MAMSTYEAEYVALAEVSKEIIHIIMILEFMGVQVKLPVLVRCDNEGTIFLTKNNETKRTKHIDIKYHVIREYVENDVLKIVYVRSEENVADPMTKNTGEKSHILLHERIG